MSDSQTVPQERVRIFRRDGRAVAEFETLVERSWVIGDEARARFYCASRDTDIVNDDVLQFGNWVLVENDKLPAWVGVIDTPRRWDAREVEISAYTPERVFSWRRGPIEEVLDMSAGEVFVKLIQKINAAEQTLLREGQVFIGPTIQETLNPTLLNRDLRRIYERSGEEYRFRPVVENGRLRVYCDWVDVLGNDTQAILQAGDGGNLEENNKMLVEDDPLINEWFAYGDGETWTSKPSATVNNQLSIQKYGLRQGVQEYSGVTNEATLVTNANQELSTTREPLRTGKINALNVGDTFSQLALGNRLTLRLEKIGFTGTAQYETLVRIIGMKYDPEDKNVIELVTEEVINV